MHKFVLKRLLMLIPIFLGITFLSFSLIYIMPTDAAVILAELRLDEIRFHPNAAELYEEMLQGYRDMLGLNDPFFVRLWNHYSESLSNAYSALTNNMFMRNFWITFRLAVFSFIISTPIGITLGVLSAAKHNKRFDRISMTTCLLLTATPSFILAILFRTSYIQIYGWVLRTWDFRLPSSPILGPGMLQWGGDMTFGMFVMPVAVLSVCGIALIMLMARSSMLEVMREDYIMFALAKGQKYSTIVWKHALRNVMIPILTVAGLHFSYLLGSAFFVEAVFNMPGILRTIKNAAQMRNVVAIQNCLLIFGATIVALNFVVDLLYGFFDPRIRGQYK